MSLGVVFANRSGFDAPIGVILAWEERGSSLNIFRTTNRGRSQKPSRITRQKTRCASKSNTSVPLYSRTGVSSGMGEAWIIVLTYSGGKIAVGSQKPHELRVKRLVAQVSQTRRFANRSGFDAPIESSWHGRSVDHVLTYSGRLIAVVSQKPSRITRQKTCWASESNTWFALYSRTGVDDKSRSDLRNLHVLRGKRLVAQVSQTRRFANRSGFDVSIGVVLAGEERGSCLNIFRRQIAVGSQNSSLTTGQKTCCGSESSTSNLHELRGNRLVAQVSQTRRFANRSGFDAPIGVVLAGEERGSCLNIFRTTNHGWISETFTNYEAKDLLRSETNTSKPSRITRQKTCCASESNTSVGVVFANRSGFDATIGVVLAWEERGSCLNIFRTTNHGRVSETFTNFEAKDLLPKQKTCCASKSNTSVRDVFANRSGVDAPIGVVLAWEERGSCLNIFRTKNHGRISETFTNYEAKDLLRKQNTCCASDSNSSVGVVFANRSGFDAPIGVVLAWEERGSCLNIFQTTNHGQISETFTNYEAKDLLRK
ncbi:uncharacterized protein G2W53_009964 [Senna tora]|uniref:Uncharacterized protein n=1 Tax=Senna tora TaxID=362788 RepID=A0A834WZJ8_9FABA|nr:uncharacterized protein G2W53_009964 [Senna tora]